MNLPIESKVLRLEALYAESGGEVTPEIEAALQELSRSVDGLGVFIYRMQIAQEYWKKQRDSCVRMAKSAENAERWAETQVKETLARVGQKTLEGDSHRFTVSPSKPRLVLDEMLLPVWFKVSVHKLEPDKEKIRDALDRGEIVPGAHYETGMTLRHSLSRTASPLSESKL